MTGKKSGELISSIAMLFCAPQSEFAADDSQSKPVQFGQLESLPAPKSLVFSKFAVSDKPVVTAISGCCRLASL
jgi:hypothetical protein